MMYLVHTERRLIQLRKGVEDACADTASHYEGQSGDVNGG